MDKTYSYLYDTSEICSKTNDEEYTRRYHEYMR